MGSHDTEDQAVGWSEGAALLTGVVAGLAGRGLWGWVTASAGATLEALDTSFIVITDDETWAEEAIRQLPS